MPFEKKILIIDDETDLCLLLKDYFTRKHYEVFVCHTLSEGKIAFEDLTPDILFLDNNLPDGIGWSIAPEIAQAHPSTYIILFSAFHPELPVMPTDALFRVLEKPISLNELDKQFATL